MSTVKDKRKDLPCNLDAYRAVINLGGYTLGVITPKGKRDKLGKIHYSSKHISPRYKELGKRIESLVISAGAQIVGADGINISANLNKEERLANVNERINLQTKSIELLNEADTIFVTIDDQRRFADSTFYYWEKLKIEAINKIKAWLQSDKNIRKGCSL